MKFQGIRLGHGVPTAHRRRNSLDKRDGCSSDMYKNPAGGQSVDANSPLDIVWDPSCLTTSSIDIYLHAPSASIPLLHSWEDVPSAAGIYTASLQPGWWNSTSNIKLEVTIAEHGVPPYLSNIAAGPYFTATYNGEHQAAIAGSVTVVGAAKKDGPHLQKGAVAAAVLIPLLVLIGIVVGGYLKWSRAKGKDKRKAWNEAVDKRMSTISVDWKSTTAAGANAAVRHSMAVGDNRKSSFSFGAIRPSSTFAVEGHDDNSVPPMSQLRPGLRASAFENRVSRVSFAADPRPSMDSRKSRTSRAYHVGVVPPLPIRQESSNSSSVGSPILSPTQTHGPLTLTAEDIRSRMAGEEMGPRPSMDEVMPALSLMRTGSDEKNELLFEAPALPSPTFNSAPKSPLMGVMPMPASVMSPDELLRAYAERRAMGASPPSSPAIPSAAMNFNGNGMRTLYSPDTQRAPAVHEPSRKSLAPTEYSRYDDEDAYGGTA